MNATTTGYGSGSIRNTFTPLHRRGVISIGMCIIIVIHIIIIIIITSRLFGFSFSVAFVLRAQALYRVEQRTTRFFW